jgi:transposase, IS5 family
LDAYLAHGVRQIDQIRRRVLAGERIPHVEKVFSIFQRHTEWISKGKAGVAVELALRVAISGDQYRFILHRQVMEHTATGLDRGSAGATQEGQALGRRVGT